MPIEVTCSCGRVLKAPDSAIGKKGRCKGCGQTVEIFPPVPDEPVVPDHGPMLDLAIEVDEADAPLEPRIAPKPNPPLGPTMPPEPFYYGFLVFYAYSCIFVAVCQFVVAMWISLASAGMTTSEAAQVPVVSGAMMLMSTAWMLGMILVSCPILLAVDAARNVRAMRYGVRRSGEM